MNRTVVESIGTHKSETHYECFFAAAGYETRATHIAQGVVQYEKGIAVGFDSNMVLSYENNRRWFVGNEFDFIQVPDSDFEAWFRDVVSNEIENGCKRLAIDVSCFNRFRLASMINVLKNLNIESDLQVDFLYNIAAYSSPPDYIAPNVHIGPVIDAFAGWSVEPEQTVTAVVGVGYEEDRGLGAVEHVQASTVWAYVPFSLIHEYEHAVREANATLFDLVPASRRIPYPVHDPYLTFVMIEGLVYKSLLQSGVIIFPFGPKIFAVCSLLAATVHPDAAVWRVSPGDLHEPTDRLPSDHSCGLSVKYSAQQMTEGANLIEEVLWS